MEEPKIRCTRKDLQEFKKLNVSIVLESKFGEITLAPFPGAVREGELTVLVDELPFLAKMDDVTLEKVLLAKKVTKGVVINHKNEVSNEILKN